MVLYLLNALIVPISDDKAVFYIKKISVEEAREIVKQEKEIVSAIGHAPTAEIMSKLLGIPVLTNRVQVYFKDDDKAIALVLKKRLPEGVVLQSIEEIEKIGFDLFYIERTRDYVIFHEVRR